MFKKTMKKLACGVLAIASITACMSTFSACETAHPEVEMTIQFDGKDYVLEYQLYRNVAPSTVNHFLWLAENGYYNGLCVHDYKSDKLYTGAYSVDAEADAGLKYKAYYEEVAKLNAAAIAAGKNAFPVSVYADSEKANSLYNLYGEFEDNNFHVENGDKSEAFGSLTMYYNTKSTDERVYVVRNDDKQTLAGRDYKYNSATSQFYITLGDANTNNTAYCTFAYLVDDEDNVQALTDLKAAIQEKVDEAKETEGSFTDSRSIVVNQDDAYVGSRTETFKVPTEAIVIKSVVVTKF